MLKDNRTYYFKGRPYRIVFESQLKKGDDWVDCIVYTTLYDNPAGTIWVRESLEFFQKFRLTKEG